MAAMRGGLYVMFFGPPSPKFLDPLLDLVELSRKRKEIAYPNEIYMLISPVKRDLFCFPSNSFSVE